MEPKWAPGLVYEPYPVFAFMAESEGGTKAVCTDLLRSAMVAVWAVAELNFLGFMDCPSSSQFCSLLASLSFRLESLWSFASRKVSLPATDCHACGFLCSELSTALKLYRSASPVATSFW